MFKAAALMQPLGDPFNALVSNRTLDCCWTAVQRGSHSEALSKALCAPLVAVHKAAGGPLSQIYRPSNIQLNRLPCATLQPLINTVNGELGMASDVENKDVVIYYNDSIDSDNTASALALALAVAHKPNTRVIWILEPRQVSLGLSMSKEETARCLELIKEHPSSVRGTHFKVLLGGLLEEKDLASFQCLDASDRELASLKPSAPWAR